MLPSRSGACRRFYYPLRRRGKRGSAAGLSSKFSNITVDGVKIPPTDPNSRDVDLSMLSQGALSGIELHKTLTADQDADAIAGSINLVTKKAPSERLIQADLKGDYNYLMKSENQYDFSARYGERFFDDILGVQIQGNTERKIRSREDISNHYHISNLSPYNVQPSDVYEICTHWTNLRERLPMNCAKETEDR